MSQTLLKVFYQNVQNLQKRCHFYGEINADVVALCETCLERAHRVEIGNYRLFRTDGKSAGGGGVLIAARRWFRTTQLPVAYSTDFEIVCIRIEFTFKNIFVICSYISPGCSSTAYNALISAIGNVLAQIDKNDMVLLLGDFNLPTISEEKAYISENLIGSLQEMELCKCSEVLSPCGNEFDIVFSSQPDLLQITNSEEDARIYSSDIFHAALRIDVNIDGCILDSNSPLSIRKHKELIQLVKGKPFLYDSSNKGYGIINLRQEAWKQIAKEVGFTVEECRSRWRFLRDSFRKRESRVQQKWYFKHMNFIIPYLRNNEEPQKSISRSTAAPPRQIIENNTPNADARISPTTSVEYSPPRNAECRNRNKNDEDTQRRQYDELDVRPFVCKFENCGRRYTRCNDLSRHERIHSGQNFTCDLCEKKFMRNDHVIRHMKLHFIEDE